MAYEDGRKSGGPDEAEETIRDDSARNQPPAHEDDVVQGAGMEDLETMPAAAASGARPGGKLRMLSDGASRRMLVSAGLVFAVIAAGVYYGVVQTKTGAASNVGKAPSLDATPGGSRQAQSPHYQETLEKANEQQAREAREGGGNFIPTVEQIAVDVSKGSQEGKDLRDGGVDRREREEPIPPSTIRTRVSLPEPAQPEPRVQTAQAQPAQREKNPYEEIMSGQIGLAVRAWSPKKSAAVELPPSRQAEQAREIEDAIRQANLQALSAPGASLPALADGEVVVRAGGLVYARMINSVNSDTRSPVLAEIVSGPLKGARMMGTFTPVQASGGLSVSFRSIALEDGRSTSVEAYAVDGFTAESLVASSVDHRLLARYGPILAASFVTGLADAYANTGTTISEVGGSMVVSRPEASLEKAASAGVARAASAVSSDLTSTAPRGALIKLESGYPVAIMFMETLVERDGEIMVWDSRQSPGVAAGGPSGGLAVPPLPPVQEQRPLPAPARPASVSALPRSGFEIIRPYPPLNVTIDGSSSGFRDGGTAWSDGNMGSVQ